MHKQNDELVTSSKNIQNYWALSGKAVEDIQGVAISTGLNTEDVQKRLEKYGTNSITSLKNRHPLQILANQFLSPFILLLTGSTILSFFFKEWMDGIAILIVMVINAAIGFWMEYKAQRTMEALKKQSTVPARVIRNGQLVEIASADVVPGDLLFIEGGEMITADARLLKVSQLQTDESALTGESLPVDKNHRILALNTPLAERTNMLYKGTFVTKGNGLSVVVNTGMDTEVGSIASMVQQAGQIATPLEKKIASLSKKLIGATIVLIVVIFLIGISYGRPAITMLETAIALAVAAIPEGLPVVSTLALSFGMLRLAKHFVIVKKLSAVETLGSTSVICTDKTGTLTQNNIEVSNIQVGNMAAHVVVDTAAASIHWQENDRAMQQTEVFLQLCRIAVLCNTASFQQNGTQEVSSGDPMEISLLKMAYCTSIKQAEQQRMFPLIEEVPFTSETKVMATLHQNNQHYYIAVKGAIEEVLKYCIATLDENGVNNLKDTQKEHWLALANKQAKSGLRVLAFAYRETTMRETALLHDLTFVGLISFQDPPRRDVQPAIEECKRAGIKVIMITGDHPDTAKHIAVQLGIAKPDEKVMHGNNMKPYEQLTAADKAQWLNTHVFARVSPRQKLDLVMLLQDEKMIVGMTGDGVNDAPALKKADIGIAMGQRGTQAAQEVADMILKNDAFSSIVLAIKQGRIIFDNIRKLIIYLLSCNISELLVIAIATAMNLPFQLFPLQILFINLATDVLPAIALGMGKGSPQVMHRKPYSSEMAIIDRKRWIAIFVYALVIALCTFGAVFSTSIFEKDTNWNASLQNNVLFYTLIFSQLFHAFNISFKRETAFYKTEVFLNRYIWYAIGTVIIITLLTYSFQPVRNILGVSMLSWKSWSLILLWSFISVIFIQGIKKLKWVI